jgi:hypothetical protein
MHATHFHDDHEMIVRNRAWAYAPDSSGLFGLKNSIPDFDVVGATSLFTTVHDLAAWDRNFHDGRIGGRTALDRLHERFVLSSGDTIDYAHGLSIGRFRGARTVGHGGADAGYRSQFIRFPDHGLSVAVLCNFPSANPGGRAMRVAAAYLGDALEPVAAADDGTGAAAAQEPTARVPRADLERLAGVYRGETPNQVMRIWLVDDTLRAGGRRGPALRPLGDGRFEVLGEDVVATLRPYHDSVPGTLSAPGLGRLTRVGAHWDPTRDSIEPYVGRYYSAELDTEYRIEIDDEGGLVVRHRKLPQRPLEPAARDLFLAGGRVFAFRRDATGRVAGFTVSDGRVWNVAFERR